jgi:hypothetical protein
MDYVADPEPIGDDSTTPTLCVGYPISGGLHLVRRYRDRAGGGDEYKGVALLDDDEVDKLFEELKSYREESPAYRDNE